MYSGPTQEWYVRAVLFSEELAGIQDSLQAAALRIHVLRFGLAGLSNKHYPMPMEETIPPSTSQGKCFHSQILSPYAFQVDFGDSDSGYMTTNGPCPIFKGLVPIRLLSLWRR